MTLAN